MHRIGIVLVCALVAQPAFAQAPDPLPSRPIPLEDSWLAVPIVIEPDDVNRHELEEWIEEYSAWQEWAEEWLNRRQWVLHPFPYPFWKDTPSLFSYVARPRVEPAPPGWLAPACLELPWSTVGREALAEGCQLLAIWKDDFAIRRMRSQIAAARARKDAPNRPTLFEHIHFAGLWTDLAATPTAFGLAGVHATIDIQGRWQIYALPGVMAVSVPNLQGKRIVTIGYDWGLALRLFDLRVPFFGVPARAHLNMVEVWVPEAGQKIEMIGLSLSLKKNP